MVFPVGLTGMEQQHVFINGWKAHVGTSAMIEIEFNDRPVLDALTILRTVR